MSTDEVAGVTTAVVPVESAADLIIWTINMKGILHDRRLYLN